ncbi:MAG: HlyD family secretion protein [Planctomycetota bacterium]|jgi:HlyD family secretion protein
MLPHPMQAALIFVAGLTLPVTAAVQGAQTSRLVSVAVAEVSTLTRDIELVGSLEPLRQATIRSRVDGYVTEVAYDIGDVVEAGAVLARIDVPEFATQAAVLQALEQESSAAIVQAQAMVKNARAMVAEREAQAGAMTAATDLAAAEAASQATSVRVVGKALERVRVLHAKGAATDEALDELEGRFMLADAARAAAQVAVKLARANANAAVSRVDSAKATVESAQADVLGAEAHLAISQKKSAAHAVREAFATFESPFERSVVTARYLDPGALVEAAETMLLTVADVSALRLMLAVPENELPHVRMGSAVEVRLDALPGSALEARVTRLGGALDARSRTLPVEVRLENSDGRLLPGMYARLSLHLTPEAPGVAIPGGAVLTTPEGDAFVFVVNGDRVVRTAVTLGLDDGSEVQVTQGLEAGAQVVLGRPTGMRDGDRVTVANPSSTGSDAGAPDKTQGAQR